MVYTSLSSKAGNYPYQINIAHLYGNLMNTYGDNGNILMLKYVAEKLGAHVTVDIVSLHDDFDENHYDIAFFGGGQDFEQITDMDIPEINAGGVRHSEIARRLRVTGYPAEKITETSSLEQVLKTIENQDCKHAYILATYTAMLEFRELLASRQIVRKEMN